MNEDELLFQVVVIHGENVYYGALEQWSDKDLAMTRELLENIDHANYFSLDLHDGTEIYLPSAVMKQCVFFIRRITQKMWEEQFVALNG